MKNTLYYTHSTSELRSVVEFLKWQRFKFKMVDTEFAEHMKLTNGSGQPVLEIGNKRYIGFFKIVEAYVDLGLNLT